MFSFIWGKMDTALQQSTLRESKKHLSNFGELFAKAVKLSPGLKDEIDKLLGNNYTVDITQDMINLDNTYTIDNIKDLTDILTNVVPVGTKIVLDMIGEKKKYHGINTQIKLRSLN